MSANTEFRYSLPIRLFFRFRCSLPSNDIDTLKTAKILSLKNGTGLTICRILVNSESRKRYRGKCPCIVFRQQGKQGRGSWLELRRRISLLLCSCSTNLRAACWKKDKDCGRTIKGRCLIIQRYFCTCTFMTMQEMPILARATGIQKGNCG